MRSQQPGKICDALWYLGHPETGVYLLEGRNESMIISGGMSYIAPALMDQIQKFGIKQDKIRNILILHAHFDHIGIVPFFRRRDPDIQVYASERAAQILSEPRNILTINDFSHRVAVRMGMDREWSTNHCDWTVGLDLELVSDGDIIDLGGIEVMIFNTPGHSSCSISAYAPKLRALFPSDGGGIPYKDTIVPAANSNFTQYVESLKKLESLEVEYLCADHFGYVYGDEAGSYLSHSIDAAQAEHARLKEIYLRVRDIELAAQQAASSFLAENPDYFLTFEIYEGICRQMMKHISRHLNS
jgi:glyoxylase-like metal-dependent hydrolase (beta-lactamase superfamily II)